MYSQLGDRRLVYIDELELDPLLKEKVLAYLTEASTARGANIATKYGLVNGWVDSSQAVQNCGSLKGTGPINKVLLVKACYPLNIGSDFDTVITPDLNHSDTGSLWYGIYNDYVSSGQNILTSDESEWLITLSLDITLFYEQEGFVGIWMYTGGSECFLELDTINDSIATAWFIVRDPYATCDSKLVGVTIVLTEDKKNNLVNFKNMKTDQKATLSESLEYVLGVAEA